uniref:HTH La-type RNA-binding domain-containing protein n=1 Tax=Globodera rostochiensis TaxID=31243 RepID=A0A914GT81_GLORO
MRGFDLDGGTFFMCTEISPRCFTIQQVSDVDVALKEVTTKRPSQKQCSASSSAALPPPPAEPSVRRPSSSAADVTDHPSCASHSPFLPMLPWWFTAECRQKLMGVPPPTDDRAVTPDTRPPSSIGPLPISQEQLRQRIQRQLEYYFSRENLINDRYLRCQMDADQYVPIKIVANFPKVTQLTTDLDLIVDVLKASSQVQVDESGQKVRPMSRRCTIILREIPEDADENEVKSMFGDDCPPYQTLSYGLNNSWYVTFATEQDTQKAFFHLQTFGKTFNGSPVFARIKTGGAPIGADMHGGGIQQSTHGGTHIQLNGGALRGQLIIHHGHIMTDQPEQNRTTPSPNGDDNCGFSPRATFRPMAPSPTPLQSTASAVPEPTSFFTQPILHNGDFTSIHHRFDLRRVNEHRYVHLSLRGNTPPSADDDEDADQAVLFDENHCCDHHHYDREECCDEEFGVHFDDIASDSVGGGPLVLWQGNGRGRKRSRAYSEPSLAYRPAPFAVGRNEFVLRQRGKEHNRSWDPGELAAALIPSPVPRITDVPRLNGKAGNCSSTGDNGGNVFSGKQCLPSAGGTFQWPPMEWESNGERLWKKRRRRSGSRLAAERSGGGRRRSARTDSCTTALCKVLQNGNSHAFLGLAALTLSSFDPSVTLQTAKTGAKTAIQAR